MKNLNYIINKTIILLLVVLLMAGCELEKDPIGLLTPEQINTEPTETGLVSSVNAAYKQLGQSIEHYVVSDIASDDVTKKWTPNYGDQSQMSEVEDFTFTSENKTFDDLWSKDFEGIGKANLAISYLTDDELISKLGVSSDKINNLLGQVLFIRAYYYFHLVINFGDVPLILTPPANITEASQVVQSSAAEIWTQISKDLSDAKTLMPSGKYSDNTEKWRVSKGAVIAMQAKIAVYNEKWQEVIDRINELQSLNYYNLNDLYTDNFVEVMEYLNDEVIFDYNYQVDVSPSNTSYIRGWLGWGFLAPTQDFIDSFEPDDPRLAYTVNISAQRTMKLLGENLATRGGNNSILIRYADVLLWKAEALINLGNDLNSAIDIINSIRERARNSYQYDASLTPPSSGTLLPREYTNDKNKAMEWLVSERRLELGFENQRFYDLKRWKLAKQVLNSKGIGFKDYNYLYPIPQAERDRTGGALVQNPGY